MLSNGDASSGAVDITQERQKRRHFSSNFIFLTLAEQNVKGDEVM